MDFRACRAYDLVVEGVRTYGARRARTRVAHAAPRAPGIGYAVLSLVVCVLVGALALTSRHARPPTIAEFAPQAVAQINDGLADGKATEPKAAARPAVGDAAADLSAAPLAVDVARVRQCVGDPPRQIEDPQSPPCVPYWTGDNGGATARGVTRDEIRITDPGYTATWSPAFQAFFNKRFEFYGRRIRLIPRVAAAGSPAAERAAARAAYEQDQPFASAWPNQTIHDYYDEIARLGVVAVQSWAIFPETYMSAHRPYLWSYPMANDRMFALVGNWYCARFSGRNAVHSGDPLLQASRRKPGIILADADWEGTSAEPMNAQFGACGDRTEQVFETKTRYGGLGANDVAFVENAILQMKSAGVTTVAILGSAFWMGDAMKAATSQGYFPEWLATSFLYNQTSVWLRGNGPPEQMKSLMVLHPHPMQRTYTEHASTWALQEAGASTPSTSLDQWTLDHVYQALLLLASGIQLAGPHLTPVTFERGLHRTRFPNPPHPIMAGEVGFADGDHSMTDDAAELWWNNAARGPLPDDAPGAFCYVDGGVRRRMGAFPAGAQFFSGPCDTGSG